MTECPDGDPLPLLGRIEVVVKVDQGGGGAHHGHDMITTTACPDCEHLLSFTVAADGALQLVKPGDDHHGH